MKFLSSSRSTLGKNIELSQFDLETGRSINSLAALNDIVPGRPLGEERRRMERELILKYDSKELKRGDAWFLIETAWIDEWMAYIIAEDDPECPVSKPSPLANRTLYDPNELCLKKGLVSTKDYRGVNPQVYALYAELYGTGGAKPICRWTLDIYELPVMIDEVQEMLREPELRARVEVSELNEKFLVEEELKRKDEESVWYRCLCRCEFLVPFLAYLFSGPSYDSVKKQVSKKRRKNQRRRAYSDSDEEAETSEEESDTRGLLG